jgi:hypothetical protein
VSTVLVVVIAGVIIVAIAVATVRGDPKPATGAARPDRATAWEPAAFPTPPPAEEPHVESELVDEVAPPVEGAADERSLLHRLRSMALLGVTVVVLGSLTAGLLGVIAVVAAHAIDRALG